MCNAHNHSYDCECGFGGDTGGGGAPVVWTSTWTFHSDRRPLTHPVSCWWCGAMVYFYRDENGGCAMFDHLGAPWVIHSCWEEHRTTRRAALHHAEREIQDTGFDGEFAEDDFALVRTPVRAHTLAPFWGIVIGNSLLTFRFCTLGQQSPYDAVWADLPVVFESTLYPLQTLHRMVDDVPAGVPLKVSARWVDHASGMLLLATSVERRDLRGRLLFRRRIRALEQRRLMCDICGRPVPSGDDWDLILQGRLECSVCRTARGGRSPADYARHCRSVAARYS
jgi:hypothetical protein